MAGRVDPYTPRFRERRIDPLIRRGAPVLPYLSWAGWLLAFAAFSALWVGPMFFLMIFGVVIANALVLLGFGLLFCPLAGIWVLIRPFSRERARDWAFRVRLAKIADWTADFCFGQILDRYLFPMADRLIMDPLTWLNEKRLIALRRR